MPQSTLSRILSEKIVDPSDKHVSKIAEYFGVSTDQLRGRVELGESREAAPARSHAELRDISLWDDDTPVEDDEVSIPFLREVELAAGSGRFVIEESEKASLRFGKRSLRHNGVQFDQAKCVTVRGNSMLPVLRDGATVGVNAGKSGIGDIVDGDLYAINHNGQLRVKQLYRLPTGIRLRSFNRDEHPDEDYSFQQMQEEQISILGHVFLVGHVRALSSPCLLKTRFGGFFFAFRKPHQPRQIKAYMRRCIFLCINISTNALTAYASMHNICLKPVDTGSDKGSDEQA
ncbi:UNVERIFIED_ORG: phage repressor protein C with HTH and peptisase S24 domain [Pseudomonas vranovensis]|nr:phage repressor protein C with HTH and peptisase S24 domain [Pseudomonas vranovensis]